MIWHGDKLEPGSFSNDTLPNQLNVKESLFLIGLGIVAWSGSALQYVIS